MVATCLKSHRADPFRLDQAESDKLPKPRRWVVLQKFLKPLPEEVFQFVVPLQLVFF